MVGGLLRRKPIAITVAEADFQAVAHAVARLGHVAALSELLMCSAGAAAASEHLHKERCK